MIPPEQLAEYRRLASDTSGKEERHPLWANIAILKLVDEIERLRADNVALVLAINDIIQNDRAAAILQRYVPEAFERLVEALFVD